MKSRSNCTSTRRRVRAQPGYAGEHTNLHGLRITPEFGFGLTRTLEAGLYLPTVLDAGGSWYLPGLKLRLKWLPLQPRETPDGAKAGWYAGTNFELARIAYRFEDAAAKLEMRNIVGWRGHDWSFAANPILRWGLTEGHRGAPEFELDARAMRSVARATQVGIETYYVFGRLGNSDPVSERDRRAFAVVEHDFAGGWGLHLGAGRGNGRADRWTLKAILSVPWN